MKQRSRSELARSLEQLQSGEFAGDTCSRRTHETRGRSRCF